MVSVTSASSYITSASCYHPRYQSRSSMYIRGLILRNFAELAEAVPIAAKVSLMGDYTKHNKFSNFLCFASFLCSSLCNADQFQLQCREHDLRQMKPRNFRRHPLNRHLGRARIAVGVSKQKSHPL